MKKGKNQVDGSFTPKYSVTALTERDLLLKLNWELDYLGREFTQYKKDNNGNEISQRLVQLEQAFAIQKALIDSNDKKHTKIIAWVGIILAVLQIGVGLLAILK